MLFFQRIESKDNFKKFKTSFRKFIALENYFTYVPLHDSSKNSPDGFSESKKIALWSRRGKTLVTEETFKELIENLDFDLIECFYDDQNGPIESKKRAKKIFERTENFIETFFSKEKSPIKVFIRL